MASWIIRRILQAVGVMLVMTVIVFLALHVIGDPVEMLVSPDADQIERARVTAALGLDRPLLAQYGAFLGGLMHGDLGNSFVFGAPALQVILQRLPATLELAVMALLLGVGTGVPLGMIAGLKPRSLAARTIMTGSILGFSVPAFWVGLLLIMLFAVKLHWLPASGRGATRELLGVQWSFLTLNGLSHMILPAITLSLFKISLIIRLVRAGVQEVLPQEFIRFARAKGVSEGRIVRVHVLKSIAIPIVTVVGLEFGSVIAFSVVVETIFAWPGIGKLIIDSINLLDRPMIVAYLVLVVVLFVTINLVVDLAYRALDPRVRLAGGA